jgi:opacity protein-like surface antigen
MKFGIATLLLSLSPVFAGEFSPSAGTVEVFGGGGINMGPSDTGTNAVVGGDVQVYASRWLSVGGGGSWAPVMNRTGNIVMSNAISTVTADATLYTFHGGVQIHAANGSRATPYATVGAGGVRMSGSARLNGTKYFSDSSSAFAFTFGGGCRVALAKHIGIRFEVAGFKGRDTNIFGRALVGVYGQFGGR